MDIDTAANWVSSKSQEWNEHLCIGKRASYKLHTIDIPDFPLVAAIELLTSVVYVIRLKAIEESDQGYSRHGRAQ